MENDTTSNIPVQVMLFSVLRERTGERVLSVTIPNSETVESFVDRLAMAYQPIADLKSVVRVAVNKRYATANDMVSPGDEIALITPVSGG